MVNNWWQIVQCLFDKSSWSIRVRFLRGWKTCRVLQWSPFERPPEKRIKTIMWESNCNKKRIGLIEWAVWTSSPKKWAMGFIPWERGHSSTVFTVSLAMLILLKRWVSHTCYGIVIEIQLFQRRNSKSKRIYSSSLTFVNNNNIIFVTITISYSLHPIHTDAIKSLLQLQKKTTIT